MNEVAKNAMKTANLVRDAFREARRANTMLSRNPTDENLVRFEAMMETYQEVSAAALRRCVEDTEFATVYVDVYSDITFDG